MSDTGDLSPEEFKVLKALTSAEVFLKLGGVESGAWRAWRRDFDRLLEDALNKDNQDFTVAVVAAIYLLAGRYPSMPQFVWDAMWAFEVVVDVVRGPLQVWLGENELIVDRNLNDETHRLLTREGYRQLLGVELIWPNPRKVASIVRTVAPVTLLQNSVPGRTILILEEVSA